MKKIILTIFVGTLYLTVCAQKPMWLKQMPSPDNSTYLYKRGKGVADTEMAAQQLAIADAMNQGAHLRGQRFDSDEINHALQNGTDYKLVSHRYKIPLNIVADYTEATSNGYRVFVLCQVAKAGYDELSVSWSDCTACDIKDNSDQRQIDRTALACSLFPGLGQIIVKKNKPVGYAFMIGDLALIGGGVFCLLESNNQYDISQNPNYTSNYRQDAYDNYKMLDTSSKILFGAAAAVYVINLYTAYKMPKKTNGFALTPKLIPENNDLAFGVGISYNF